jgi:hypothetical protein
MDRRAGVTAATAAAVALLLAVGYGGSLGHPLLHDDRTLVGSDWVLRDAGPVEAFTTDYWHGTRHEGSNLYRPLTVLSIAWNARWVGDRIGFRAVNLLLHALSCGALFAVVARIAHAHPPAAAAAILFAVHPLASESVLWVVGRAEILAAIFGMISLRLLLDAEETSRGAWRLPASLAAFALALFSKESAACWILVLPAGWAVLTARKGGLRRGLSIAGAYALVFALFLVAREAAVAGGGEPPHFVDNPLVRVDAATRIANAVLLLGRYLGKMLWPATLTLEYGFDAIPVRPLLPWVAPAALAAIGGWVGLVAAAVRRRAAGIGFFLIWIPASFAVTGNVAFPIGTIFAERLAYLALAGGCALVGIALAALPRRAVATVFLVAVAAGGAARTRARAEETRDLRTLTEATAAASPRSVKALFNAGRTRLRAGAARDAVEPLERAVALWPGYARGWLTLSEAYAADSRAEDAARAEARAREEAARSDVR